MIKPDAAEHFDKSWKKYDRWYETHPALYGSELRALSKAAVAGRGLEIGVGSGRFAVPLSVRFGLDPAFNMLRLAKRRGIRVVQGCGESLPFADGVFSLVLIVFVLEFVSRPREILQEATRVLQNGGRLIVGFIDADSRWGEYYERTAYQSGLYDPLPARKMIPMIEQTGLLVTEARQTLFGPPPESRRSEEPRKGFGRGGFVVLHATKSLRRQAP
ncbi:MAG: class I SAM-dependent methyltransferase [Candidatus Aminicenantes bacterium]|nr:class I SAM-dependent methyltransferase [Candidatus Aminicenantes bacterium]